MVKYVHVHPQYVPEATTHEGAWCTVSLSFKSSCNRDLRISSGLKVNTHQDGCGGALSRLGLACLSEQIRAKGTSVVRLHVVSNFPTCKQEFHICSHTFASFPAALHPNKKQPGPLQSTLRALRLGTEHLQVQDTRMTNYKDFDIPMVSRYAASVMQELIRSSTTSKECCEEFHIRRKMTPLCFLNFL